MSAVDAVLADDQLLQAEFAKLSATEQAVTNWQMKWLEVQFKVSYSARNACRIALCEQRSHKLS